MRAVDLGAQLLLALLGLGERRVQRVVLGGEAGDLVVGGSAAFQARAQLGLALAALGQRVLDLGEAIGEICFAGGRDVGGPLQLGEARDGGRADVVCLGEAVAGVVELGLQRGDPGGARVVVAGEPAVGIAELGLQGGGLGLGGVGAIGDRLKARLGAGCALALGADAVLGVGERLLELGRARLAVGDPGQKLRTLGLEGRDPLGLLGLDGDQTAFGGAGALLGGGLGGREPLVGVVARGLDGGSACARASATAAWRVGLRAGVGDGGGDGCVGGAISCLGAATRSCARLRARGAGLRLGADGLARRLRPCSRASSLLAAATALLRSRARG